MTRVAGESKRIQNTGRSDRTLRKERVEFSHEKSMSYSCELRIQQSPGVKVKLKRGQTSRVDRERQSTCTPNPSHQKVNR
jgi:hypothetical protein